MIIFFLRNQDSEDLRKIAVIPAEEPGSSRLDLGSARFALDRDDKKSPFCVSSDS